MTRPKHQFGYGQRPMVDSRAICSRCGLIRAARYPARFWNNVRWVTVNDLPRCTGVPTFEEPPGFCDGEALL